MVTLHEWIDEADRRGLIASIYDLASLPPGLPCAIVPLEETAFQLREVRNVDYRRSAPKSPLTPGLAGHPRRGHTRGT